MTKTKQQKLEEGSLRCACQRVAVAIKSKDGVCARCLDLEKRYYGTSKRPNHGARSGIRRVIEPYVCHLTEAAMS